jgi:hypothetical protein
MSGKNEKRQRRARGISKAAERAEREFAAQCARVRYVAEVDLDQPIVRRDSRRRVLALIGLVLAAAVLTTFLVGAR